LNKILSIKSNAIFLAVVLIAGAIAAISPSFITGVNAQSEPYPRDNSYEREPREYPPQYADSNRYNSYEPEYEMNNDRKSYGNDNIYKSQYSSYKPNYKSQYPSNGQDSNNNYYKSKKDSSNNVNINKLDCININLNINGNNTGDINIGNKGQVPTAEEGYLDAYSSGGSGYSGSGYSGSGYGGDGYYDGYDNKKDKDFSCIINNNNNNTNVVSGAGNATDGGGNGNDNEIDACEESFRDNLDETDFEAVETALAGGIDITIGGQTITVSSLTELCTALQAATPSELVENLFHPILDVTMTGETIRGNIILGIAESLDYSVTEIIQLVDLLGL